MPSCEGDKCRNKLGVSQREDGRNLCDRCLVRQQEATNASTDAPNDAEAGSPVHHRSLDHMLVNELLTYVFHHQKNSSADAIKRMVREFYTPEEIKEAKQALWDVYGAEVLGTTPTLSPGLPTRRR